MKNNTINQLNYLETLEGGLEPFFSKDTVDSLCKSFETFWWSQFVEVWTSIGTLYQAKFKYLEGTSS